MVALVKFFGLIITIMGIVFMLSSDALKKYIGFWRGRKRLIQGGVLSLVFGVVFLLAAPQCRLRGLVTVFGIWAIIKGMLLFTIPQEKINAYFDWWMKKPDSFIRFFGIFAIVLGVLFIYAA